MPQGFPGYPVAGTKTPKSSVDTGSGPLWDKESGPPGPPNPRQDNGRSTDQMPHQPIPGFPDDRSKSGPV